MSALKQLGTFAAGTCLLAASGVAQADFIDDWVDGFWVPTGANTSRGLGIDYFKTGLETGVVFAAYYTYEDDGDATWYTLIDATVDAGEYVITGDLVEFEGGTIDPADGPIPNPNGDVVGTATITVNDCGSITFDVVGTDVDSFTAEFTPGESPIGFLGKQSTSQCVYQESFDGCPDFATPAPTEERGCSISGEITESVTLTNDTLWFGLGRVYVGNQDTTDGTDNEDVVVTIEPGTRMIWGADGNPDAGLFVQMGARVNAQGAAHAPIVMAGPVIADDAPAGGQQWGGLIVHGRAPVNVCDGVGCAQNEVDSSFYGGDLEDDSSGIFRYVRIQNAGGDIDNDPERQYNGAAFHGVGRATVVENVQVHDNRDDAFEWFGGTVNGRNLVATNMGDDGLDWVQGWRGRVQNVLVVRSPDPEAPLSEDPRIIEADNLSADNEAEPVGKPWIANGTFLSFLPADGAVIRRGTGVNITNSVFQGGDVCFEIRDLSTLNNGGTGAEDLTGNLTINNTVLGNCTTNFSTRVGDGETAPYTTEEWFNAQDGNVENDVAMDGVFLPADSPYRSGFDVPYTIFDDFFQNYDWMGAFQDRATAWTHGWTLQDMDEYLVSP